MDSCLELLRQLVAIPTVNPGSDERVVCNWLREVVEELHPSNMVVREIPRPGGDGVGAYLYAEWGRPTLLFNIHIDTVPVNSAWTRSPFELEITEGRAYGLGSADTKGAVAALLTAACGGPLRDVAFLFSGDEENGSSVVPHFIASEHCEAIENVIVCEPTERRLGVRHRGMRAYRAELTGTGGHSSRADQCYRPIAELSRLAVALDEMAAPLRQRVWGDMKGLCLNIASLAGGIAVNVIPERAQLEWSLRPPPEFEVAAFEERQRELARACVPDARFEGTLNHPPFACRDAASLQALMGPVPCVTLDFWTEAALFAQAGKNAAVIGPGSITQAHCGDEYVLVDDLEWAVDLFKLVLSAHCT